MPANSVPYRRARRHPLEYQVGNHLPLNMPTAAPIIAPINSVGRKQGRPVYHLSESFDHTKWPRFAAGPRELEKLLEDVQGTAERRIAIIVDGLDHADRISGVPTARLATEIADELAGISLPKGAVVTQSARSAIGSIGSGFSSKAGAVAR